MGIKIIWLLSALVASAASISRTDWPSLMQRLRREVVDLHSGEFCVDVSTYGAVVFEPTSREKCDTTFMKQCEDKNEQVCDEVTEIQCEIVPYTECSMTMEELPYKSHVMVPKTIKKKVCSEGMDVVQHTKMMPDCRNVTKQNCISTFTTDEQGEQVWAGNEACEPVTWRECKLVPRQVDFKVPKINCEDGDEVPYTDCEEAEKIQMITKMTCEVKHTTDCKPVVSTKCGNVQYQECTEEPEEKCEEVEMSVPKQEKQLKKKCLLPDDGANVNAALTARGAKQLGSIVAAAKAQALAEQIGVDESRRSFARPLPLTQQSFHKQSRQGRAFQGHHRNNVQHKQQNRRFQQQTHHSQGQFVRGN